MDRRSAAGFYALGIASLLALNGCSNSTSRTATSRTAEPSTNAPLTSVGVSADLSEVQTISVSGAEHVETPVSYPQSPPVGGDHSPGWQNCGSYAEIVPNELAVHSMEHGAVWITYDPALDQTQAEELRALSKNQTHVLVTQYEGLGQQIVLSAWEHQLRVDSVNDPRIALFIAQFQNGPQTPEPGSPCSGAIGKPM
jgi:Protein of unknown function (DUF3105)